MTDWDRLTNPARAAALTPNPGMVGYRVGFLPTEGSRKLRVWHRFAPAPLTPEKAKILVSPVLHREYPEARILFLVVDD